jgi:putative phosphoesterase
LPRGARRLPEECVARCRDADLVLHAGDVTSAAALDDLRALGPPVEAVHGNMDEAALREALPEQRVADVDGVRIGVVHVPGPRAGQERRLAAWFPGCAAVVYGHTHVPQVEHVGGVWILNPGSPTERRSAAFRSMLMLHVGGGELRPELVRLS